MHQEQQTLVAQILVAKMVMVVTMIMMVIIKI
jgi:hypothetical protein